MFNTIIIIALIVPVIVILLLSIWAVYDISGQKNLTREKKSSLTAFIVSYPIYGVFKYILSVRPNLNKDEH